MWSLCQVDRGLRPVGGAQMEDGQEAEEGVCT